MFCTKYMAKFIDNNLTNTENKLTKYNLTYDFPHRIRSHCQALSFALDPFPSVGSILTMLIMFASREQVDQPAQWIQLD